MGTRPALYRRPLLPAPPREAGTAILSGQTGVLWFSHWELPCDPKQDTTPFWVPASFSVKWGKGLEPSLGGLSQPAPAWLGREVSDGR